MNVVFYKSDDYYLSYLELGKHSSITLALDTSIDSPHLGATETALCIINPDWKCLILLGDHRAGYEPIKHDLEACKKYWEERPEQHGFTTDYLDANVEA